MRRTSIVLLSVLCLLCMLAAAPSPSAADGALAAVESEFRDAIRRLRPATVVCLPAGVRGERAGFSSGVIVSPDGLVLSDGDAGLVYRIEGGRTVKTWHSTVDVRVPRAETGSFVTYRARVLKRDRGVDTSLLKIDNPPPAGFAFVPPRESRSLRVGDFAFIVGSSSFTRGGAAPTLTAGVVAAFGYGAGGTGSPPERIYVSAAVNEGVNGGPLVDLEGRLVGTVSTHLDPTPTERYQFLGKAIPMDRIRTALGAVPAARALFRAEPPPSAGESTGHALEAVFHDVALRSRPILVSLTVARTQPVSGVSPVNHETVDMPRYVGPFSGVVVSSDGLIATSLYNVTNVGALVDRLWGEAWGKAHAEDRVQAGIDQLGRATVHLPDGRDLPAAFVGYDPRSGIAVFRAAIRDGETLPVPTAAPESVFQRGRFVIALGNPFGRERHPVPLLTVGILSRFHPEDAPVAWRGQWQTDASGLDTNAGGFAADVEGRALGMMQLWHPARHGRSSGVAFLVPWRKVQASVADIVAGAVPGPALLGVRFLRGMAPVIESVVEGSAAQRAGLVVGDRVLQIDREEVPTILDTITVIRSHYAGETVRVRYERNGRDLQVDVVLGGR